MTDDPFLPKPATEGMRPAQPTGEPVVFEPTAAPAAPSDAGATQAPPPAPSDAGATQAPPSPPAPGAPEYYQPQAGPQAPPPPPAYAQPGQYPVPYAPYPPTGYAQQTKPKTWMNWVAFGCGLGAIFTCVSFIPAIIFGHLGLAAAKRGEADARGFGLAGLIVGYVVLGFGVAYIVFLGVLLSVSPTSSY